MVRAIRGEIAEVAPNREIRSILFEGDGKHFSFGASVEEHLPGPVQEMLPEFHQAFRELFSSGKVLLAAVRGMCLGGCLELAAFCHRVFASAEAIVGNPEIKLGVFAPVASVVLPARCGQAVADELLLTGRTMTAEEALQRHVIDELADDPASAAVQWQETHLQPLSGAALFHAARAARHRLGSDLEAVLGTLEGSYLKDLLDSEDAREGIAAFVEKREPQWKHR
jgi:cyclohexa-1,5-dienecarbonyl-CoA hydratase